MPPNDIANFQIIAVFGASQDAGPHSEVRLTSSA